MDIEALARRSYQAYVEKNRAMIEDLVAPEFSFTSPYDDHIDRKTYFERCWPNAERIRGFDLQTLMVHGSKAFVQYELHPKDGAPFRNAELLSFADGKLVAVEVFFGQINGVEQKP